MREEQGVVGIIGCGHISRSHLKAALEAGLQIGGLCDIDPKAAEEKKREFDLPDVPVYSDYEALLKDDDIDIVAVTTPPALHLSQTVAALDSGKYVYCEKPVAHRPSDFSRIFDAERKSGKAAYFTCSRYRARDGILMKQYVDQKLLGHIYRVDARHFRPRGRPGIEYQPSSRWFLDSSKAITGISADMGMYFMDKAFYLTDWPAITSVSAQVYKLFPYELPADVVYDVEEHIVYLARTNSDLTFTFEFANISHHERETSISLLGTLGGLKGTSTVDTVEFRFERGAGRQMVERPAFTDKSDGDTTAYRELGRALKGEQADPGTTSHQAHQMQLVLQMAFQSARERREISPADLDPSGLMFPGLEARPL